MEPPSSSGFYVSRAVVLLLAGLTAVLLIALAVIASLYGRCVRVPRSDQPSLEVPNPTSLEVPNPKSFSPLEQESSELTQESDPVSEPKVTATSLDQRPTGPWDQLRLPPWMVPLHYDLELWPRLQPNKLSAQFLRFTGRVNITVRCAVSTTRLLLHSLFLGYDRAEVWGPMSSGTRSDMVGRVQVHDMWFAVNTQYVVLELGEALQPGSLYELHLNFSGSVSQEIRKGLFFNEYTDQGKRRALLATQMEPTYARTVFPCFDEPALKATFNITIIHHPRYVALSNMPQLGQSEKEDVNGSKWTVTTFYTTPHMSTYTVALAICDFDKVSIKERGKEIHIWARKDAMEDGYADFALNITGPIFSFLEDLFNISYPLPKTDLIALPFFDNRAMENWGLLVFDESLLLLSSDHLTETKTLISSVLTHEIAHQWFGNLVTMNWWNNIWLNEGFASYFEFQVMNHFNSKLPRNEIFFYNFLRSVLREDHALVSRTVSTKVENFTETSDINKLFDLFTYYKGASMARMLSSFLSERLFISAVKSYLKTFSYSNSEQDDLWRHFQMAVDNQSEILLPATVKTIMDGWTHQSGFPVITLNMSTGFMKQEPFYLEKVENWTLLSQNNTWITPIFWIKNGATQSLVWLDKSSKVFPEMQVSDSDQDWVILNLNMTGYYRVNYDKLGWKKISQQLVKDPKEIPVIHRLQLINDAFALSKSNYIEIESALDLTKYLAEEDEILVWNEVLLNLIPKNFPSDVNQYKIYPLLKKYLLKKLNSIWDMYSTIIRENEADLQDDYFAFPVTNVSYPFTYYKTYPRKLRNLFRDIQLEGDVPRISLEKVFGSACWLGFEDCLQLSRELFRKWMNHPENVIPYPIKNVILCYGIALGSDKEWDFLLNVYINTTNEEERFQLAHAMSCSKDPWILNRYMEYAITTSPFTFNDTNILAVVAASEVGRYIVKDFLINNWQSVVERYGTKSLYILIVQIGRTITTDLQITELQKFFSNVLEEQQMIDLHDALQIIKNENLKNIEWGDRLAQWLQKNT